MGRTMSTLPRWMGLTAVLAGFLVVLSGLASPVSARRDISFALFGSRAAGWGFTNTSLQIPGPTIQVSVGDNVTLNLTSLDGRNTRRWYIDYNNNSAWDSGTEPRSPPFGTGVLWNFTASNVTGTYRYRSTLNGDAATMWGNITITPAGSGGPLQTLSGLLIPLIVVVGIAVVAILVFRSRRSKSAPPPPPPPEE